MNQNTKALVKNFILEPAQDFYRLRREGIGFIEQMGSKGWTDYNTHDPGITTLEALCYAITDLAYRIGWDIKDILSPETASPDPHQPYPNQAFFSAREILTVNPTTPDDLRRLLIDLEKVRNAWVLCKECACDVRYYAWCDKDKQLLLSYEKSADVSLAPQEVWPRGLYEALLELEVDPELGDLNDRKIEGKYVFHDTSGAHTIIMELRFPDFSLSDRDQWRLFLDSDEAFATETSFSLTLVRLGAIKTYDVFSEIPSESGRDTYIRNHWRKLYYLSFEIEIVASGKKIHIENVSLRLFSDVAGKTATTARGLKDLFEDKRTGGFIQRYREKAKQALTAVESAKTALQAHRNLDEDYCTVKVVGVEEIAVCADVEVKPDADIERVQARIWFEIEQYFNPSIRFHALQELLEAGEPVEEIFNGPALASGFIKADDLEAASLKTVLPVSDLINRLMDIDGVIAVNQLLLTKYDAEGIAVKGAADPTWVDGKPVFDTNKSSASWLMFISNRHQPRFYLNLSRFLFYKNGLPFQPRMDEASNTLNQLRGEAERPKNNNADKKDLNVPKGSFRNPEDYYPVQYSFPQVYGTGTSGLPSHASALRRAQAKQLKAYLMVFEQVVGNSLAQLAHTADLFSLDPSVTRTYFVKEFSETLIRGFDGIKKNLDKPAVEAIAETLPEFQERRNRFLDHLLARFGEQFSEYALLLRNAAGQQVAQSRLVTNKISFLQRYPAISHDRSKAFDYKLEPCADTNYPGIKKRISLLLGFPDLKFVWTVAAPSGGTYPAKFHLIDGNARHWLNGGLILPAGSEAEAKLLAHRAVIGQMIQSDAYDPVDEAGKVRLKLKDKLAAELGQHPLLFDTEADAIAMRDEMLAWSANERLIVVEHLLLRPKFPGDALYPACSEGACQICGDEDPYSFRLTFVMPGWTPQSTNNLDLRRFAERTIQQETPSHLLGKICWVGNDGFIENPCDPVIDDLADLLVTKWRTANNTKPTENDACSCALAIYKTFSQVFQKWYEEKTLTFFHSDALDGLLGAEFTAKITPADIACTAVLGESLWSDILMVMVRNFSRIAKTGWQFERFEDAWCKWLEANAGFDWMEERVQDRVEAMLRSNIIITDAGEIAPERDEVCKCAAAIVTKYGMAFFNWMDANVKAGTPLNSFPPFTPEQVTLCPGLTFKPGTDITITTLLNDRYKAYTETSYRLRIVVNLLATLRNTYPGATLHDCDEGSDENPVRLGKTALGNYPLRQTFSPTDSPEPAPSDRASTPRTPASRPALKAEQAKSPKNGKRKGHS